jgi:hypothetical protein
MRDVLISALISLRIDIPKDGVLPRIRRAKGVEYLMLAGPGFKNMDQINQLVKESWRRGR